MPPPAPRSTELTFDGSHVRIGCSPAQRIVVHGSPKLGKSFYNPDGSPITHAELDLPPIGEYVYFSVYTADGKAASYPGVPAGRVCGIARKRSYKTE